MKKLLVLLLSFGLFSAAHAQFGVRAGYSSANFSNADFDAKGGFHAGLYYTKDLGFLSVEPGIQFAQKGYKFEGASNPESATEQMNYVDVPVLVRVNFLPFLNVFAGPQVSALVSRKYENSNGDNISDTKPVKGYDIAGIVGVGVQLASGFNFQLSYDIGLQNIQYYGTDVKNNVFKASLGYDF
jgi:hypothetical protein